MANHEKLYYGINDSTKPAVCLSPSNAPHQNCDEPFYQDYACMSDRQPNSDQYSSEDNEACSVKITEPEMQSYTVDIVIYHADDDFDLRDDTAPALVEDDYNVTPDSFDVISLNDPASQVSKEVWQSFPSHQNLSDLSSQNMYSSTCSSTPMFKQSSQDSEQSSSMPTTRGKIYFDKDSQDREDNAGIELVQKYLPDQGTFQTYNDIQDEGQCVPPLPQKVQQCSSAPVEDLTDKVVLLKSVQDSPVKASTSTEPTEESIKIPPDPTDENLTTTACTSFHEPLPVPSIQAVDGVPLLRTDYQFLSNSFACEYSEPDPYYPPDTFSLQPSPLELPEDEPTQCPQRPFLSSAVPFSSELQLDHISSSSTDTARNSDVFRGTLDDLPIDMHSDTQDLAHDVFNYLESKESVRREPEPTAHAENHAKSHAKTQDTLPLVDVSLRPVVMIENESVKPVTKDVPKPDNDSISVEPEQQQEECVPPKEAKVCNTDQDPTEETELPSLDYAGESVVPIPNETHNIVDPVPGLTTAPRHKPGLELPEASAVYEPFPPHQEPHPCNEEIPTPVERPIGQVKEVPAHSVQEACLQLPTPDIPQRQDSEFLMHPIADPTFLNSTTPLIPFDVLYTDSGGDVRYIGSNCTAYSGRLWMLCLTGFINGWLPKHNTPLCPCETVTVGVG